MRITQKGPDTQVRAFLYRPSRNLLRAITWDRILSVSAGNIRPRHAISHVCDRKFGQMSHVRLVAGPQGRTPPSPPRGVAAQAHRRELPNHARSPTKSTASRDPIAEFLPSLAAFLEDGSITVAAGEHACLTMLKRRKSKTLTQLLTRLDDMP